jgi:hypothetical protein
MVAGQSVRVVAGSQEAAERVAARRIAKGRRVRTDLRYPLPA